MAGYIGSAPVLQATQTRQVFTATASQTTFNTSGYTSGYLDVYLNGLKLVDGDDFTASNGSDVVLTLGADAGDSLEVVAYDTFETISTTVDLGSADEEVGTNEQVLDIIYPVGSLRYHPVDFPGVTALGDRWQICDGASISDADSPSNGYRIFNLTGGTVTLSLSWTADSGGSYCTIGQYDRWAINVGDTVSGSGVDADAVVVSMDRDTGACVITQTDLAGSVSTSFTNEGIFLGGGSSDKISHADQMQGHKQGQQFTSSGGSSTKPLSATDGEGSSVDAYWPTTSTVAAGTKPQVYTTGPVTDGTNGTPRTGTRTKPHGQRMPIYMRIK